MCGRFSLTTDSEILAEHFDLAEVPRLEPRYNIAPTQDVAVVRETGGRADGRAGGQTEVVGRRLVMMRWGLLPAGGSDPAGGAPLINARSETVMDKPSFREAFRHRRCLVLADGFFEWERVGGRKQPIYFKLRDGMPFAFAGIWERWLASDAQPVESCAILTCEPNELVRRVHDRMPVILNEDSRPRWLARSSDAASDLVPLLQPYPEAEMRSHPVSPVVNNAANESPECVAPYRFVTQQDLFS